MHRKGKKALKGKKSRKGEDESADASLSAAQVEAQPGTRLKPKQKKKLLKEVSCSSSQTVTRAPQDKFDLLQGTVHQALSVTWLCMFYLSVAL